MQVYPRVLELSGMSLDEGEEAHAERAKTDRVESVDKMMAHLLIHNVFRPAGIESIADFSRADNYPLVRAQLSAIREQVFNVFEEFALAA